MENNILFGKSDELAHLIYKLTRDFPKEEIYGLVSQLRRAAISVPANITEGFARRTDKSYKQFLLISFGSLKELKYLLQFSFEEEFIDENNYKNALELADECAKMLWKTIETIGKNINR